MINTRGVKVTQNFNNKQKEKFILPTLQRLEISVYLKYVLYVTL